MFYDENILKEPILIENNDDRYKYKIQYLDSDAIIIYTFIKNKKKRRSCLVLINKGKKQQYLSNKTKDRLLKYGILAGWDFNIVLDIFKKEKKTIKEIIKKYQSKNKKKIQLYHKLYYYKSKNKEIPKEYLKHCELFKSFDTIIE